MNGWVGGWVGYLVDDDVVRIDLKLGQLLHQTFGFINGEKLRYGHTHKGSGSGVAELTIHFLNHVPVLGKRWVGGMKIDR